VFAPQAAPAYSTPNSGSPASSELTPSAPQPTTADANLGRSLNLVDLELLHNFTTSTFSSLSTDPVLKTLWRINVPQLGLAYEFVMHGILAFSALHLAHYSSMPTSSFGRKAHYIALAASHHQEGLRMTTALLPHVNTENCSALYIFTALSSLFAIANSRLCYSTPGLVSGSPSASTSVDIDPALSPAAPVPTPHNDLLLFGADGIPDWLILFRGTRSVVEASQAALLVGVLGPMFAAGARRSRLRDEPSIPSASLSRTTEEEALDQLRLCISRTVSADDATLRNRSSSSSSQDHDSDPANDIAVYDAAIAELQKSFAAVYHPTSTPTGTAETADVFIWLFRVTDAYLALLRRRTQPSLAILAFFCPIARRLDGNWWMQGWSDLLMGRIWSALDEEHRLWVQWPVEEMGWLR
jgi:hypothetical protein